MSNNYELTLKDFGQTQTSPLAIKIVAEDEMRGITTAMSRWVWEGGCGGVCAHGCVFECVCVCVCVCARAYIGHLNSMCVCTCVCVRVGVHVI